MMNWMLYTMFNWAREMASQRKAAKDAVLITYYVVDDASKEIIWSTTDRQKAFRRMAHEVAINNRNFVNVTTEL